MVRSVHGGRINYKNGDLIGAEPIVLAGMEFSRAGYAGIVIARCELEIVHVQCSVPGHQRTIEILFELLRNLLWIEQSFVILGQHSPSHMQE